MALALALIAVFAAALLFTRASVRNDAAALDAAVTRETPTETEWLSWGIRFFSWIAGIALFLAAVFAVRSAEGSSWLLPVIGIVIGLGLVFLCWRVIGPSYAITASAVGGAGIGMLYAALYALHRFYNVPLTVTLIGILIITAAAAMLAIQRDSPFLAFLGLIGAFAIPALLGFDKQPYALFSYLLVLNIGVAWVAYRRDWPVLTAFAVTFTVLYEWAWVLEHLTLASLPLAAAMFALLAAVGASPLWSPPETKRPTYFRIVASLAALLPFLFALYMATEANYAARYNVLFGFLLVVAAGIVFICWRGGPRWIHAIGGIAVLATFTLWFVTWLWRLNMTDLYPADPVPGLVLHVSIWIALFVALYLIGPTIFAALMFGAYIALAARQPSGWLTLIVVMTIALLLLLAVTYRARRWDHAAIALVLSSFALMAFNPLQALDGLVPAHALSALPPMWLIALLQAALFAGLLFLAWRVPRPWLAVLTVPLYAATIVTTYSAWDSGTVRFLIALVPYLVFVLYAFLVRSRESALPYAALVLASVVLILTATSGLVALPIAAVMFALLLWWWLRSDRSTDLRFAIVFSAMLAFFNLALFLLLPHPIVAVLFALQSAGLILLWRRFPAWTILVWSIGLAIVTGVWITFDADLYIWWVFLLMGAAMYAAAVFSGTRNLSLFFSLAGLTEHWLLINISIANWYKSTGVALNSTFDFASPLEDVTYTVAWAIAATGVLIYGVVLDKLGARAGGTSLLILAALKAFFHDLPRLDGNYRVASLAALALAFLVAGFVMQKYANKKAGVAPA
jgi:Predicted membrane protein (DUF2339)